MHFPRVGGENPRDDACERPAMDSPTVEIINHPEVIILDDDKSDNEPAARGNRHQSADATVIELDGGQQDASFPEQNDRISSPSADAVDRLSLCKMRSIFYC